MNKKKELLKIRRTLRLMTQKMSVLSREMGAMHNTLLALPTAEPHENAEGPEKE